MKRIVSRIMLTVIPALAILCAAAQNNVSFSGSIVDSSNSRPIPGATVTLQKGDLHRHTITNEVGLFSLSELDSGFYKLNISGVGYRPFTRDSVLIKETSTHSNNFLLNPEGKTLAEITVTPNQPYISQSADKITLNVAASPIAAGSNAWDVLQHAPGVVNENGNLKFRGSPVNVLIEGRPSHLSGEELKNMLSAMPANGIAKVEILPDPSSKYDAQGGSVINIKLAKNKNFGTNGTLTMGSGLGHWLLYNGGVSLNHRNKKMNVYGSYDYMHNKQYYDNFSDRIFDDGSIYEKEYDVRTRYNHSGKAGLDYDLTDKTSIGFLATGFVNYRDREVDNQSWLYRSTSPADSSSRVFTNGSARFGSPSVNLYLKTMLDTSGKELAINANYFNYNKKWNDDFITRYYDEKDTEYGQPYLLRDFSPANNEVLSATADYVHPVKSGRWEAGLKTALTTTDNDLLWEYADDGGDWKTDHGKTNRFIYKELIHAAYTSLYKKIKQYSFQMGLRAEYTYTTGRLVTLQQTHTNDYINLFPNLKLQYAPSSMHQWSLGYRKSIQRFDFGIVNPFIVYQSQYSYSQGNPDIRPMIMHSITLDHSWKYQLFSSLRYTKVKDAISLIYLQKPGSEAIISSFDNLSTGDIISATITWMGRFLNGKWISTNTVGGYYSKYRTEGEKLQLQNAQVTGYLNSYNSFQFKRGLSGEFTAMYRSPAASGAFKMKSYFTSSAGLAKDIWKKKASLKLNVKDIFNTESNRFDVNYQGIQTYYKNKTESRTANLSFTWKFGNSRVKASKKRETGMEDESSRMGAN